VVISELFRIKSIVEIFEVVIFELFSLKSIVEILRTLKHRVLRELWRTRCNYSYLDCEFIP
jgi:hypothetical protein